MEGSKRERSELRDRLKSMGFIMKRVSKLIAVFLLLTSTLALAKTVEETANEFYKRGLAAVKKGAYEQSVDLITKAIELAPTEYRYYNDRGVVYKRMGKLKQAVDDYTTALQIKPDYTNAWNNRGVSHFQQGDYKRAIEDFDQALRQGGLEAKILTNRGLAYLKQGDSARAVEDFRKAVSYRPLDFRAFIYLGEALEKTGQKEKAVKMYQLALGLVKNRETSKELHQRIREIEKAQRASKPTPPKRHVTLAVPPRAHGGKPLGTLKQSQTLPGSSEPAEAGGLPKPKVSPPESASLTLSSLETRSRQKAVEGFSNVTREIYEQGVKFVENSDQRKAVVRFQDALQLARRARNNKGVAWCLFEIGRVHSAMGEYFEALPYLKSAMKNFLQMKSRDEAILTLVELTRASRYAGLKNEEEIFEKRAKEMALSEGYGAIEAEIGPRRPKARISHQINAPEPRPKSAPQKAATSLAPPPRVPIPAPLARVGRGPYLWGKRISKATNEEIKSPLPRPQDVPPKPQAVQAAADQPGRVSFNIKSPHRKNRPTTVEDQLLLLRKLRKKSDEKGMIDVLETLSSLYEKRNDLAKALYCLDAAIGFREKLGDMDQMSRWLHRRGLLREKQDKQILALEDFTRAADLATIEGNTAQADTSRAKAKHVAKKLRLDPENTLAAFQSLWDARKNKQKSAETRALHSIAGVFRDAGKPQPAIDYLDRTSASLLLEKVDMLAKLGKDREAEKTRTESLRTLKKLDYSRYLETLKKRDERAMARRP